MIVKVATHLRWASCRYFCNSVKLALNLKVSVIQIVSEYVPFKYVSTFDQQIMVCFASASVPYRTRGRFADVVSGAACIELGAGHMRKLCRGAKLQLSL